MSKFVVHKKGFFYTDEAFEAADSVKGSITGIFTRLDEAQQEKTKQDILSIQNLAGSNVIDFFFYNENYHSIVNQLKAYYKSEFSMAIEDDEYFEFPATISEAQAAHFLTILQTSFHDIIEYPDETILNPEDYNKLEEQDLGEF
ncbi:MAG: hypothetical protein J0I41_23390 [Filimonas sp.]|nr:hypothetical protein [Filimonas sp.]